MKYLKYFLFLLPCWGALFAEVGVIEKREQIDEKYVLYTFADQRKFFAEYSSQSIEEGDSVEIIMKDRGEYQLIKGYYTCWGFFYTEEEKVVMHIAEDDDIYLSDGLLLDVYSDVTFKENDHIFQFNNINRPELKIGQRIFFRFEDKIVKAYLQAIAELDAPEVNLVHAFPVKIHATEIDKDIEENRVTDVTWYIAHLSGGEMILSQKELDSEKAYFITVNEKDSVYYLSNRERNQWREGLFFGRLQTDKVTRTVTYVNEEQIVFDDGFILSHNSAEFSIPETEIQAGNGKIQILSVKPLDVIIDLDKKAKIRCDTISGLHIVVENEDEEYSVKVDIRTDEDFIVFCGLGEFRVGDQFDCYQLSDEVKKMIRKVIIDQPPEIADIFDKICFYYRVSD